MTYDPRTITHGTQQVSYGPSNGGKSTSFATGVFKFAPSVDQDTKDVYADAILHMTLLNAATLTIDQSNYQMTSAEMAQAGHVPVNGGFTDGGNHLAFAVQRLLSVQNEDGSVTPKIEVFYNVTSGDWSESDDEDDDEINPKEYSRTLTVKGVDFGDGKIVKKFEIVRSTDNASVFDTYKTKILVPADFKTGS